jgi:TatD DNase family protein
MLADAHIHLADLGERDPGFPERIAARAGEAPTWVCCAASHSPADWERTEALRSRLPPFVSSYGLHPQDPGLGNAAFLEALALSGRIAAIGEAGFDFFGDRPERVRNAENESAQRAAFEFQLELAEHRGLPMLLHIRKAMDLVFEYAPRLKRLRGVVLHSYSGSAGEAASLLARGVPAWFSFGASVINGNKRAAAACASVPAERLLAETDAPWQPPRRGPSTRPDACRLEDLGLVIDGIAALRGLGRARLEDILEMSFRTAYM